MVPQKEMRSNDDMVWESRMLGGRTRINGTLYLPGCRAEYDTWGEGWAWDDISKFFTRSEGRLELESGKYVTGREGNEWKTRVIKPQFESSRQYVLLDLNELIGRFANALSRLGVPCVDVFDDPDTPTCFGLFQRRSMNASGKRCSTYHAFLPKSLVSQRRNLTIVLGAHVQRILYSDNTGEVRATSLVVEGQNGQRFAVRARHEIILSGGSVVTPQLLMLRYHTMFLSLMRSGIGPKDHLSQVGKPCIQDLPGVGSTLVYPFYVVSNSAARSCLRSDIILRPRQRLCASRCCEPLSRRLRINSILPLWHRIFPQRHFRILLLFPHSTTTSSSRQNFASSP